MTDLDYRIAKLEVKPGDMLVAKLDRVLTVDMREHVRERFGRELPEGVKVLILERGMDISVLTFDEIQARAKSGSPPPPPPPDRDHIIR